METLEYCPVCNAKEFSLYLNCKDYTVSGKIFQIQKCICGFIFTNPRPDSAEISQYYESEDYVSHSNTSKGFVNKIYKLARTLTLNSKVRFINKLKCGLNRLLDYGCGTGEFLSVASKNGWAISGYEPNSEASKMAVKNYQVKTIKPDDLNHQQFEVITLWHVLEHIHDLRDTINKFYHSIVPNGHLVIAVPNVNSFDANEYGEYWAAYDVPRHLYHFNRETLVNLLGQFDFNLEEIKGMPLDPFYISLLSEKYKSGETNFFKAFANGINASLKSKKNVELNSSLVYIFKRS